MPTLETDGFMYGIGIYSDSESDSPSSEVSSIVSSQKPKTPRKFGTDLTHSNVGNADTSNTDDTPTANGRSRSAKKSTSKKAKPFAPLSTHYEDFDKSPQQEIKSRFHAKRNNVARNMTSRNLELEGTLRRAEMSVQSANSMDPSNVNLNNINNDDDNNNNNIVRKDGYKAMESEGQSNMSSDTRSKSTNATTASSKLEYTVHFEPGSIGLKVEPVIKNGEKEFGCRVMKFVDTASPSQAIKSGRIEVGHVLTAVNGRNVTAKTYADIVALLADCKADEKNITFRIPRSPTAMPLSPASLSTNSTTTATTASMKPYSSVATPRTTKSLPSNQAPFTPIPSSSKSATPPTIFSPSFVKKMTRTTVKDHPVFPTPSKQTVKTASVVLNSVMKNLVPDKHRDTTKQALTTTGAISKRISELLTGSHSKQFDETAQMKVELLNELSEAKETLSKQEINVKKMENMVESLAKENSFILSKKEVAELTLADVQKAKEICDNLIVEKEAKIQQSIHSVQETMARNQVLAKQNGSLRAQYEQLKIQSNGKERELNRQLNKLRDDLAEESSMSNTMKEKLEKLQQDMDERDNKIGLVSKELMDRTNTVHSLTVKIDEKEKELQSAQSVISNLQSSLQNSSQQSSLKASDLGKRISTLEVENDALKVRLDEAESITYDSQQRFEKLSVELTSANEENLKLKEQLNDSKQILESTIDELHRRLADAHKEIEQRKESEVNLSSRELEQNQEISHLNKVLQETQTKNVALESNCNRLQTCLFENSQKSKALQTELHSTQERMRESDVEIDSVKNQLAETTKKLSSSQNEVNQMKELLDSAQHEIQDLVATNKHLQTEKNQQMKDSQEMRLQLSELQRNLETKETYYSSLVNDKSEVETRMLEDFEQRAMALTNEMNKIRDEVNREHQETSARYEAEVQRLKSEMSAKDHYVKLLEEEKGAALKSSETLQETQMQLDRIQNDYMSAQETMTILQNEKGMLCSEMNELRQQLALREQSCEVYENMKIKYAELEKKLSDYNDQLKAREEEVRSVTIDADTKFMEKDNKLAHLQSLFAESVKEKEDFIEKLQTEIEQKQDAIDALRRDIDAKESFAEQLAIINRDGQVREAELQESLRSVEEKLETAQIQLDAEREILKAALATAEKRSVEKDEKSANLQALFIASIKEKEDFIDKLQTNIEEKQDCIESLRIKIDEKEALVEQLSSVNQDSKARDAELRESLLGQRAQLEQLEKEREKLKSALDIAEKTSAEKDYQLLNLQETFALSIKEKEDLISNLQTESQQKQNDIESLAMDVCNLTSDNQKMLIQIIEVEAAQNNVDSDKENLRSALLDAEKRAIEKDGQLSHLNEALTASINKNEELMAKFHSDIQQKQDAIDSLALNVCDLKNENEKMLIQLVEMEATQKKLDTERETLKYALSAIEKTCMEKDYKIAKLQESFAASIKEKEDFIDMLQTDIERKQDAIDSLQSSTDEKELLAEQLLDVNRYNKAREAELQESLRSVRAKVTAAEKQLDLVKESTKAALAAAEKRSTEKDDKIAKLQESFAASIKEKEDFIDKLQTDIEHKQDAIDALQSSIDEKELLAEQLSDINRDNKARELELQESLRSIKAQLVSAKKQLDTERESTKAALAAVDSQSLAKEVEFASSQEMLIASVKEKEDFIVKLQADIEEKQTAVDSLALNVCDLSNEKEKMLIQMIEVESELASLSNRINDGNVQFTKATNKIESLQIQLEEMKLSYDSIVTEKTMVETELTEQMNWYMTQLEDVELSHQEKLVGIANRNREEISKLTKILETATKDTMDLNDEISKLRSSLKEKADDLDDLKRTSSDREAQLNLILANKDGLIDLIKVEKNDIAESLSQSRSLCREKEQLVETLNANLTKSEKLIADANEWTQKLEQKVETYEKIKKSIKDELTSAYGDLNLSPYRDESKNIVDEIRYFVEATKDIKANAVAGFELASSRERAVSRLERTLSSKERDIESLHVQVKKFNNIIGELKSQQKELKDRNSDLESKVNILENEMADIESNYEQSEDIIAELQEQKRFLACEIKYHKDELLIVREKMLSAESLVKEYEVELVVFKKALNEVEECKKANENESSHNSEVISSLEFDLEAVSSELERLIQQNETLEQEISCTLFKVQQSEQKEKAALEKIAELETELKQQTSMMQTYENENESLFEDNRRLLRELDATEAQLSNLKDDHKNQIEKINLLESALSAAEAKLFAISESTAEEKEKLVKEKVKLESQLLEAQSRLTGFERLAKVHDKESVRLLNDIESKAEHINSLGKDIIDLEATKTELMSTINEQKKSMNSLQSMLETKQSSIKTVEENLTKTVEEREFLQSKLEEVKRKLDEREQSLANLEKNLNHAENVKSSISFELNNVREEVSACKELLSQKDESIAQLEKCIAEAGNSQDRRSNTFGLSPNSALPDDVNSTSNVSPSTTDIVTKHFELLQDLAKMKSIIHDAITPAKQDSKVTLDEIDSPLLQKELETKNNVLMAMEAQVGDLLLDITTTKSALNEKVYEVGLLEKEKDRLVVQMNNIRAHLNQVEQSLHVELRRRRKVENDLNLMKKENQALALECESKSAALVQAKRALAVKSRDVDEREDIARQLAHQLQTTKHKIIALKAHLKREGLLHDTPRGRSNQPSLFSED